MSSLSRLSIAALWAPVLVPPHASESHGQVALGGRDRIAALDGVRGILAMMVVASHYFGEVPHGLKAALVGWIAVKMFFVLSGFLMAHIILDNISEPGFFKTFYIRRACRTLPVYLVLIAIVFGAATVFRHEHWMQADQLLPLWSYLSFTQGFVMIARGDYGLDWLTPTWTLTVEEQFYLVAPLLCLLVPRRYLMRTLVALVVLSMLFRLLSYGAGLLPTMTALILLPATAHSMGLGMIAALLLASPRIDWRRYDQMLRVAPIACFGVVFALKSLDGETWSWFQMAGVPLVSVACALYLLSMVRGSPEAERMHGPWLQVLGRLSYSIYLLHMPVLGLMHGLILDGRPDIATPAQIAVTFAAVPAALLLAWIVNRTIEEPMIAYGRSWRFKRRTSAMVPPAIGS